MCPSGARLVNRLRDLCALGLLALGVLASLGSGLLLGGGGGYEEGGMYACSYEVRSTDGCDGYGWGEWEAECMDFNADDYTISPEEVCANVTEGGAQCESSCCVDYDYQNVELTPGSCY